LRLGLGGLGGMNAPLVGDATLDARGPRSATRASSLASVLQGKVDISERGRLRLHTARGHLHGAMEGAKGRGGRCAGAADFRARGVGI
jgi:hypothetical protein